jgi:hypothetical protein
LEPQSQVFPLRDDAVRVTCSHIGVIDATDLFNCAIS